MFSKVLIVVTVLTAGLLYKNDKINVIKWQELEKRIHAPNDTTYIFNFWATWCKPCVEELPDFERINEETQGQKVKVVLVSMDMSEWADTKVPDFMVKKNIQSEVVLLDEVDGNIYINKVDSSWSGAIPATLIVNNSNGYRYFHEGKLSYEELKEHIK